MFCEKCGKPTDDEQVLCPECAAQQADAVAEAVQPEESVQPAEVVDAPAEDTFELNTAESAPKKKKKKGAFIGIVAAVTAAAVLLSVLCWPSISAFFSRTFQSPENYLADVESDAIAEYTGELTAVYGQMLKRANSTAISGKTNIELVFGESLISLAETALQQQGADLQLDWLSNIDLSLDAQAQGDLIRAVIALGLSDQDILSLDSIVDLANGKAYLAIPQLNDQYLTAEIPSDMEMEEIQGMLTQLTSLGKELIDELPSESELNKLINNYVDVVLSEIKNVEKQTKKVSVGDASQQMVVLTAKITQKDLLNIAEAVLKEAEDDKTLEKVLDAISTCVNKANEVSGSYYYEPVDLHEELVSAIPDLMEELDYAKEDIDKSNYIKLNVYVDMQNNVRGHKLNIYSGGEKMEQDIYWLSAKKGDTIYTEAKLGEVEIKGETVEKKDISSGELEISANEEVVFTIEFEDVTDTTGTHRLIPGEAILEEILDELNVPSAFLGSNVALELITGKAGNPNYLGVNILMGDKTLLGLSLFIENSDISSVSIPSNALEVNGQDDLVQWLQNINLDGVLNALENAGVPGDLVDALEGAAGMLDELG